MRRRLAAIAALLASAAAIVLAAIVAVEDFPKGLPVVACVLLAAILAWLSIARRGAARVAGLAAAALLLIASVILIGVNDRVAQDVVVIGCAVIAVAAARYAFTVHVALPQAERPRRPVLFWNPRSGDGKATRFHLEDEARARGIEPIELTPGHDLEALVRDAVTGGADALSMAGGDGSQAVVARIAAELDLPYACIPAGTRNHFALDLGVDRDDVVGALDAFVDGGERRVDLAEVNGRVFVNNVSLGVYAEAVQRSGYREAKLRTIFDTFPEALDGNGNEGLGLHWRGPDGREESSMAAMLVSNNAYRLGRAIGSGTRPSIESGTLGVAVFDAPGGPPSARPWREWTAPSFEVAAEHSVHAGIDGEAATLAPPLRFASRPGVLRVRIARKHPGASPSAGLPDTGWGDIPALVRIAFGRSQPVAARARVRSALSGSKELVRLAYRDPDHIPERLTLLAMERLAEPSAAWAHQALRSNPNRTPAELGEALRLQSVKIARVDGAVAGTPFFIALVPGYMNYLWQEARMGLRMAALFGREPGTVGTAAELLALRGVHPSREAAEAALRAIPEHPAPVTERRSLRSWANSVRSLLIFGGFLSPPSGEGRPQGVLGWGRAALGTLAGALIWATTWVVPVTFMIAMSWGCETHCRRLGQRTLVFYDREAATTGKAIRVAGKRTDKGHTKRQLLRSAALGLSIAVPVAFVVYTNEMRQTTGINALGAAGALVALSLVIAAAVYGSRG
jgi:hypothetical protein